VNVKRAFLFLTVIMLVAVGCAPAKKSLGDEILGTWKNSEGFTIEFRPNGSGFIPGVAGKIPDSSFYYTVVDSNHIQIDLGGQKQAIEISVDGDQLTWKDQLGEVKYTRVK
jgi:hypothetical protein